MVVPGLFLGASVALVTFDPLVLFSFHPTAMALGYGALMTPGAFLALKLRGAPGPALRVAGLWGARRAPDRRVGRLFRRPRRDRREQDDQAKAPPRLPARDARRGEPPPRPVRARLRRGRVPSAGHLGPPTGPRQAAREARAQEPRFRRLGRGAGRRDDRAQPPVDGETRRGNGVAERVARGDPRLGRVRREPQTAHAESEEGRGRGFSPGEEAGVVRGRDAEGRREARSEGARATRYSRRQQTSSKICARLFHTRKHQVNPFDVVKPSV